MQDKVRNKLEANETAVRELSELVDVDVARAAGTAPFGGGAHSFGVGDCDGDAACWGGGGEAPSSVMRGLRRGRRRRHGVSPHRTLCLSGRVVCVFVFVCVCVCTLE
jgi:hypothetical protein